MIRKEAIAWVRDVRMFIFHPGGSLKEKKMQLVFATLYLALGLFFITAFLKIVFNH